MPRAFLLLSVAALLLTILDGLQLRVRLACFGERAPVSVSPSDFTDAYLLSYLSFGQHFVHATRWRPEVGDLVLADHERFIAVNQLFAPTQGEGMALTILLCATAFGLCWWRASNRRQEAVVLLAGVALLAIWSTFCFERRAYDTHFGNLAHRPGAPLPFFLISAAILMLQAWVAPTAARLHFWILAAATTYAFIDSIRGSGYPFFLDGSAMLMLLAVALSVLHLAGLGLYTLRARTRANGS